MAIRLTGTDTNGVAALANGDTWITLPGQLVANDDTAFHFGSVTDNRYLVQGTVLSSGGEGIETNFNASTTDNKVTVAEGGLVDTLGHAIYMRGSGDTVINNGEIASVDGAAIRMTNNNARVENYGLAIGVYGLIATADDSVIINDGTARGDKGPGAVIGGNGSRLENTGLISGSDGMGVTTGSDGLVDVINNGVIEGVTDGIDITSPSGSASITTIINSGVIRIGAPASGRFAIEGGSGREDVTNTGQITGDIFFADGDDSYTALTGALDGRVLGGLGDDLVTLGDGALAQRFTFDGGSYSDTLDLSNFSSAIWVDLQYGDTQVWTRDGETLDPAEGDWRRLVDLSHVESVVGTVGLDLMYGDGEDNTFGYVGAALIPGIEQINGRDGSDTMDFSRADFAVWVDLASAASHAWTQDDADATDAPTAETPWRAIADLDSVENLTGSMRVDYLAGTDAANVFGYRGDAGFAGIEVIDGRGGADTVDFSGFGSAVWVDLAYAGSEVWTQDDANAVDPSGVWREITDLARVENVTGGSHADLIRGDGNANIIEGGEGDDRLTGLGGADTFVFSGDFGSDDLLDFDTSDAEKIDISAEHFITSFTDLEANHASEVAGALVIDDGHGNTFTLLGYSLADLGAGNLISADDFIF